MLASHAASTVDVRARVGFGVAVVVAVACRRVGAGVDVGVAMLVAVEAATAVAARLVCGGMVGRNQPASARIARTRTIHVPPRLMLVVLRALRPSFLHSLTLNPS